MALKKAAGVWKSGLTVLSMILMVGISGCNSAVQKETADVEEEDGIQESQQEEDKEAEKMIEISQELYKEAAEKGKEGDLEMLRSIVRRFGENGYSAVDTRNQIDMTEPEQVIRFCEMASAGEEAELTIVEVTDWGGFIKYDLRAKDGNMDVVRSYFEYIDGKMQKGVTVSYPAEEWRYTEEGYLMFSGTWPSKEHFTLTAGEAEEHVGFRVLPLDETYRELNRKYLFPVSFEKNNMFLTDWSEDDFGELDFYDMYDIFYQRIKGKPVPYTADDNLGVGAVYRIPQADFENIIMTYFNIDSGVLQSKTMYDSEEAAYVYKPRGFHEVEYPEFPYSEVVESYENGDGTITLVANVVFPYAGSSKVYAHEVTVRPLEDGGVQYVSNRILPSEDNGEETWHTPRLTEEEWQELYGGAEK